MQVSDNSNMNDYDIDSNIEFKMQLLIIEYDNYPLIIFIDAAMMKNWNVSHNRVSHSQ